MNYKRGDIVITENYGELTICDATDSLYYDYNRPNDKWELVSNGARKFWLPAKALTLVV